MLCQQYFSIYNLSTTTGSYESEIFFTSLCINNYVKFGLFFSNVILWSLIGIWCIALIYTEYKIKGHREWWTLKNKMFMLGLMTSTFGVISYCIMLAGVTTPVRYIFHALPQLLVRTSIHMSLRAWFGTSIRVSYYGNGNPDVIITRFNIFTHVVEVGMLLLTIILAIIGPMVYYQAGNYYYINWFYMMSVTSTNIYGFLITVLIIAVGDKLAMLCQQKESAKTGIAINKHSLAFGNRLASVSCSNKCFLVIDFLFCFIGLWLLTSRNPETPLGLNGITYYYYYYNITTYIGTILMPWIIAYQGGIFGISTTSQHDQPPPSHPSSPSSPSHPFSPSHPSHSLHLSNSSNHSNSHPERQQPSLSSRSHPNSRKNINLSYSGSNIEGESEVVVTSEIGHDTIV